MAVLRRGGAGWFEKAEDGEKPSGLRNRSIGNRKIRVAARKMTAWQVATRSRKKVATAAEVERVA